MTTDKDREDAEVEDILFHHGFDATMYPELVAQLASALSRAREEAYEDAARIAEKQAATIRLIAGGQMQKEIAETAAGALDIFCDTIRARGNEK